MASGSGQVYNGNVLYTIYWSSTPDNANNRSLVTCQLYLNRSGSYGTYDSVHRHTITFSCSKNGSVADSTFSIYVRDDANYTGDWDGYQRNSSHATSFQFYVNHDADGHADNVTFTAALYCSAYFGSSQFAAGTTYYVTSSAANLDTIPRGSVICTISAFNIEDSFSVPVTKYSESFTDTLEIKLGTTVIKTITPYTNNAAITLSDTEILAAYSAQGADLTSTFTFKISTYSGATLIGTNEKTANGTDAGAGYIKVSGTWKRALPYIKVSGAWKKAVMLIKNTTWKRGIN